VAEEISIKIKVKFDYPKAQFGESKSTCELEAKPLNNNCTRKIIPPG
jgi:hypothetical protein